MGGTWTFTVNPGGTPSNIQNNELYGGSYGSLYQHTNGAAVGDDDMDITCDTRLHSTESTRRMAVAGRLPGGTSGSSNYYRSMRTAGSGQSTYDLVKRVSSVETNLGSYVDGNAASTSQVMKLEIRAAAKKVFVEGTERISSTDENLVGNQYVAIATSRELARMDNFLVEDVPPAADPNDFSRRQPREDWLLRTNRVAEHLVSA